ncbi:4-hydroxy-tetrahydrodipicolinate synthase [Macrococcoides caseolyticum]|uniref:4-hydroxy-tetrahydrodipicolinate synthase n=1 Tax=Macrococcoides caseolyticum TaxID=69966 RepID=UPI001F4709AC|nr:4-hydroxy-tetrahydrodipicolinate synthase [Macrococcus caseolyticus]MCE4956993.1 4-hydroxy-tetrahydrodipicolinate synthase [Macrococcus caseolyticus]
MTQVQFNGTAVAITTPFLNNEVDYDAFERHIQFLIENDIQAIFVNGTTGEGSTLTEEEKLKLVEVAVSTAKNSVPIIVGTGTNNTQATIDHSLKVKALGADGIMLITPYYNKTNQRGLIQHFTTIADKVQLPVVLYNVPSRTNMTIEPETVEILAQHPYIYALKDATGDLDYTRAVKSLVPSAFKLYSGNDDIIIPFYTAGGDGVISVIANAIPKEFQQIYSTFQTDALLAENQFNVVAPLLNALSVDINPMPIKALVTALGYANGELRLPLVPLLDEEQQHIQSVYQQFKSQVI